VCVCVCVCVWCGVVCVCVRYVLADILYYSRFMLEPISTVCKNLMSKKQANEDKIKNHEASTNYLKYKLLLLHALVYIQY